MTVLPLHPLDDILLYTSPVYDSQLQDAVLLKAGLQSIEHIRYYAGWADKIHGMTIPTGAPVQAITYREPLGERMLQYHESCIEMPM